MNGRKVMRRSAWAAGILSACFTVFGLGGTMLGDYIIRNHLHGSTPEQHEQFCRKDFAQAAAQDKDFTYTEADIRGCATEKRRGFLSAEKAHTAIQTGSSLVLAGLAPATLALGYFGYRRREP